MKNELEKHLIHTYNRSVTLVKGEGVSLFDDKGKEYLDMGAGIAVCALGYSNEEYKKALKDQIDQLIHVSNLFYTEPVIKAAKYLSIVYFLQTAEQKRLKERSNLPVNMRI